MQLLFRGLDTAHGIFLPEDFNGKKQVGKCQTVREPPTPEKWEQHLLGNKGIGIIPINKENECFWAVIDIDNYELDHVEMLHKIEKMPFVFCKSKSGGIHLFLFFKNPTPSKKIREYLRTQVGVLGLGNSEIFPKQDRVLIARGDIGNWLNMPYFGDTRKCCVLDGKEIYELEIEQFLEYAESCRINIDDLKRISDYVDYDESPIKDGPPCLQTLSLAEFPDGTRNKSLFNLGVYAKKAFPTDWNRVLEKYNRELFKNPLTAREVQIIIKSLDKKDYFYQCYEEPLCSFCNAKVCRTRKYGISASTAMPIINSVTKISGDMSVWFIDVEGGRLEMTTDELFDNRKFRVKCINALSMLPTGLKNEQWHAFLQGIIDKAVVINEDNMFKRNEVPDQFAAFMMSRLTEQYSELVNGRVVYKQESHEVFFKIESFVNYLRYKKILVEKGWVVMHFKMRGSRTGVGKDQNRKSYRYTALTLTDEEVMDIEAKLEKEKVI